MLESGEKYAEASVEGATVLSALRKRAKDKRIVVRSIGGKIYLEREGLRFIGLFHCHPAPVRPSAVDLQYMRLWGEAVWLILSSINGDIAAFQMNDDKVNEIT